MHILRGLKCQKLNWELQHLVTNDVIVDEILQCCFIRIQRLRNEPHDLAIWTGQLIPFDIMTEPVSFVWGLTHKVFSLLMRIIIVLVIFTVAGLVLLPRLFGKSEAQAELMIQYVVDVPNVVAYHVFLSSLNQSLVLPDFWELILQPIHDIIIVLSLADSSTSWQL